MLQCYCFLFFGAGMNKSRPQGKPSGGYIIRNDIFPTQTGVTRTTICLIPYGLYKPRGDVVYVIDLYISILV